MAVKLPKAAEITRTGLETFLANQSEITDVLPGTPEHDLVEKVFAEEAEGIYRKLVEVQDDFYINTATADALDAKALDYNLTRKEALPAQGEALFTGSTGSTIPKATKIRRPATLASPAATYTTDVAATIPPAETTILVPITAEEAGTVGNTGANTITEFVAGTPAGVTAITNPEALDSGREQESDSELRESVQEFFNSLRRGTVPSIEAATRRVNGVFRAAFQENDPSAGRGTLLLDTGSNTVTENIRAEVQRIILGDGSEENQGYLPAGTKIEIEAHSASSFDAEIAPVEIPPNLQLFNIAVYTDLSA